MSCKRMIVLSLVVPLAGCATVDPVTQSVDRHFGEAVAWNKEVQIINPDPAYGPDDAVPGNSGAKAAEASKRYRTGRVRDVEAVGTSGAGAGGGSGPR